MPCSAFRSPVLRSLGALLSLSILLSLPVPQALALQPGSPAAEPLFEPAGAQASATAPAQRQVQRARRQTAARRERTAVVRPRGLDRLRAGAGSAVRLDLFDDASCEVDEEAVEIRGPRRFTWFGKVRGVRHSQVVLAVEDGRVAGNVWVGSTLYQIRPAPGGGHVVREIDPTGLPGESPPIGYDTPGASGTPLAGATAAAEAGNPTIDILVAYTSAVATAAGAALSIEIQLAVDETNAAYANSGIPQRLRLACTTEVSYAESTNLAFDLQRLSNPVDSVMDEVPALRDSCGADLVSLWVEDGGGSCGAAGQMTVVSAASAVNAYSVVPRVCATGDLSFGHELGHLMGARHDWYVDAGTAPYPYSHGYLSLTAGWRTIMAYDTECTFRGTACPRIPYWSNPDVLYPDASGLPMGVPDGQFHPADNRTTLNNTAAIVAAYRDPPAGGNTPPTANPDTATTPEDQAVTIAVLTNDTDPDGNTLSVGGVTQPTNGSAALGAGGTVVYTPAANFSGADSFTYTASDGLAASAPAAVTVTVTPVNDPPAPSAAPLTVAEDTTGTRQVQANDPDPGDTFTWAIATPPLHGTAGVSATGLVTYAPASNYNGSDSLVVRVTDSVGASGNATLAIAVTPVNDPPVLAPIGAKTGSEGTPLSFTASATDPDSPSLSFTASPLPAGATFDPATRAFAWTPNFDQAGAHSVTFTVSDGSLTDSEIVAITIGQTNAPPVLTAVGNRSVTEAQTLAFTLSATDPDGPALSYSASPLPAGASLNAASGAFSWTPAFGQEGTYTVTFTVTDGGTPALADSEIVTITVAPAIVTLEIPLQPGWNLVSWPLATCSYVGAVAPAVSLPTGATCAPVPSLANAFSSLTGQYDLVRALDADGFHTFDPALPVYVNDLTYVAGGYGYWIRVLEGAVNPVLRITGRRLPPAAAMALQTGWNLVGYWGTDVRHVGAQPGVSFPAGVTYQAVASIADVYPGLAPALTQVWSHDAAGDHTYQPGGPATADPVTYVGLGYGYWLKLTEVRSLDFRLP